MDAFGNTLIQSSDTELHYDFTDDQLIDLLILRENEENPLGNFDCRLISGCCDDRFPSPEGQLLFDFDAASTSSLSALNDLVVNTALSGLNIDGGNENEASGSGTPTMVDAMMRKPKGTDRSRALSSERKRRGTMKEKLFQLRALVPKITKMDKASIVGDAALYVQELQMQAEKLKAEIAGLEASSSATSENWKGSVESTKKLLQVQSKKIIMQMDVNQVEERGFYLKVVSNKGEGVAVSLYKALESLTSFNVQNSNLVTESDRFVLTFTLNVKDNEQSLLLQNLKLWLTTALRNQGFEVF